MKKMRSRPQNQTSINYEMKRVHLVRSYFGKAVQKLGAKDRNDQFALNCIPLDVCVRFYLPL